MVEGDNFEWISFLLFCVLKYEEDTITEVYIYHVNLQYFSNYKRIFCDVMLRVY